MKILIPELKNEAEAYEFKPIKVVFYIIFNKLILRKRKEWYNNLSRVKLKKYDSYLISNLVGMKKTMHMY